MSWQVEWRALDGRIRGILEAANFLFLSTEQVRDDLNRVIGKELIPNAQGVFKALKVFRKRNSGVLPLNADQALKKFLGTHKAMFQDDVNGRDWQVLQGVVSALASIRAELGHHLTETDAVACGLTLRALHHLNRSLIVDSGLAERWDKAFVAGETSCEKPGAVHLLQHGIWAFKASGEGERTDLVLGEPLRVTAELQAAAEALVLTEWKLVRQSTETQSQLDQALHQARRYSAGILAGFELASTRYLILVSLDHLQLRKPWVEGMVRYYPFNIAIKPSLPSLKSRTPSNAAT